MPSFPNIFIWDAGSRISFQHQFTDRKKVSERRIPSTEEKSSFSFCNRLRFFIGSLHLSLLQGRWRCGDRIFDLVLVWLLMPDERDSFCNTCIQPNNLLKHIYNVLN